MVAGGWKGRWGEDWVGKLGKRGQDGRGGGGGGGIGSGDEGRKWGGGCEGAVRGLKVGMRL